MRQRQPLHRTLRAAAALLVLAAAACEREQPAFEDGATPESGIDGPAPEIGGQTDVLEIDGHLVAFVDSVRSAEARRLERLGEKGASVRRVSVSRLTVTPDQGDPVHFDDEFVGGDLMRLHIFRGRLDAGFIVLERIFYEGGQFLLISERTGAEHGIDGVPNVSPDGRRFVTTSLDLVAGHQANRIVVYRFSGAGIEAEWSEEPRDWGPSHAEWIDDDALRLRVNVVDLDTQPHTMTQSVARLERVDGRWVLRR